MTVFPRPMLDSDASVGFPAGDGLLGVGDGAALRAPFDIARPDAQRDRWVDLTHSFPSAAFIGGSGAQQRRSTGDRPGLLCAFDTGVNEQAELAAHAAAMLRHAHSLTPAPLWSEKTLLTSGVTTGATSLPCVTTDRLFFQGMRVALLEPARGRYQAARFVILTIAASGVHTNSLDVTGGGAIDGPYAKNCIIVPLIDALPIAAETMRLIAGWTGSVSGRAFRSAPAQGLAGGLPAILADGATPTGAVTYDGLPIFDVWPEWSNGVSIGVARDAGDGTLLADRAAFVFEHDFLFTTRAEARRLLAWFSGRRGRVHPLWFVSPRRDFSLSPGVGSTISGTTLDVLAFGWDTRFAGLPWRPDRIAVVTRDGSSPNGRKVTIRRIVSSAPGTAGGVAIETLTLDSALPTLATALIDRIGWAFRARFDQDELTERWSSTTNMRARVRIAEVLKEGTVEVGVGDACPAGQPQDCGCAAGGGDLCSGHPAREGRLILAPTSSPELAACPASPDGYVLGQSGGGAPVKIRLAGHFRGLDTECCAFGGGFPPPCTLRKILLYADAAWDTEISIATPSPDYAHVTSVVIPGQHKFGVYGSCTGPTTIPAGSDGVLKATVHWRYSGGRAFLLQIEGYDNSSNLLWYMTLDVGEVAGHPEQLAIGSIGGVFGASGLSPIDGGIWTARNAQPKGFTALAAGLAHSANGAEFSVVAEMSAYLCPVYRCS